MACQKSAKGHAGPRTPIEARDDIGRFIGYEIGLKNQPYELAATFSFLRQWCLGRRTSYMRGTEVQTLQSMWLWRPKLPEL